MFSRRTGWDRRPNELARLREEKERAGARVLDLTESNPTRVGLAWDPRSLDEALAAPGRERHAPDPRGLRSAREAVSLAWARRGVSIPPDDLLLTASSSESYALLWKLLCDPGDAVMVPRPSYPLFEYLADLESVEAVPYDLRLSDRWRVDVDALAAKLPERARAVVVVHPNNPTGSLLDETEAARLARLCRDHGLALVSDEVFGAFRWREAPDRPLSLLDAGREAGALTFALDGLSKSCGLPQLKLGWMGLAGPASALGEAKGRLELVADTYLSVATPVQLALPSLLARAGEFRERALARIARNLAALAQAAAACGARVLPGDAGWAAVLELPEAAREAEEHAHAAGGRGLAETLLEEDAVAVQPWWFYELPPGHLVVSLIVDEDDFSAAIARLVARVR